MLRCIQEHESSDAASMVINGLCPGRRSLGQGWPHLLRVSLARPLSCPNKPSPLANTSKWVGEDPMSPWVSWGGRDWEVGLREVS